MAETDPADACVKHSSVDWAGNWRTLLIIWGLPAALMLAAGLIDPRPRSVVWTASLVWMGAACLANAGRCRRTHCRYTGPFFLGMAALVVSYAAGVLPLGRYGWAILGVAAAVGNALLWWGSERLLGRFARSA
jgi:hypothetical protein